LGLHRVERAAETGRPVRPVIGGSYHAVGGVTSVRRCSGSA
jgi:hypothetical protein